MSASGEKRTLVQDCGDLADLPALILDKQLDGGACLLCCTGETPRDVNRVYLLLIGSGALLVLEDSPPIAKADYGETHGRPL